MSKEAKTTSVSRIAWNAEQLRCTIFPSESPLSRDLKQLWIGLTGEKHDEYFERPDQHQIGKRREGYQFTITSHIDRVHFYFTPLEHSDSQESPDPGFNFIGEYTKMLPIFIQAVAPWLRLEHFGAILRVAVGAILLYPVESRIEGYKHLARLLPSYTFNFDNTRDFSYQVNRRLDTEIGGTSSYINRISRWSVMRKQTIGIVLSDAGESLKQALSPNEYACRVFLDISTPRDPTITLESSEVPDIIESFHNLGTEIAEKGDIV